MAVDIERVKAVFAGAVENVPPAEWDKYLDAACGTDIELRLEVARLLQAHAAGGDLLDRGPLPVNDTVEQPAVQLVGAQIGRYRLLEQIGEGGYGIVFMAEQQEPVRRRVALKLIKPGMDSRQVLSRFEAERQALALMEHPNIAKVFDGGLTADGRPFFVMEYVKGIPITDYCDQSRLTVADRLNLFLPVCQAVQHAHQKGVIHRDLKPSNVLVCLYDGKPVPKVIDFGLAKAMSQSLTENTLFTAHGQMVGTPLYMSPEQAEFNNLDIDTRTDVYSLGVVLYELLTGTPPLESQRLQQAAWQEVLRLIKEEEAPRPSDRLSSSGSLPSIAAQRSAEPAQLNREVRGDLDWIVMKALEKDRSRRYESPSALASDLMHHLANEPVDAAAPSRTYRLRKFVRRNKGPVIASSAILAALIAGIIGTTAGMIGESRQRAEAEKQAAIADAVSQFQSDMLASADPDKMLGDKVTVLEAIQAAIKDLDAGKLKDQPLVESRVRGVIGATLHSLGHSDEAESNLLRGYEVRKAATSADDVDTADYLVEMAAVAQSQSRYVEAEKRAREALELQRHSLPAKDPRLASSLRRLADVLRMEGKLQEAESAAREGVEAARRSATTADPQLADSVHVLAIVLHMAGRPNEAEPFYREALQIDRRALAEGSPEIANNLDDLALVLTDQGKFKEAEPLYREAIDIYRRTLPAGHPTLGMALNNYALLLAHEGKVVEAEPICRDALEIHRKSLAPDSPDLAACINNLASILQKQGKLAEAEPLYREALEILRKAPPPGYPFTANILNDLAELLLLKGAPAEAEPLFREALSDLQGVGTKELWKFGIVRQGLGSALVSLNRLADAEPVLLEAEPTLAAEHAMAPGYHQKCVADLVTLYKSWDKSEPGKGHDAKAHAWESKLGDVRAHTPPPTDTPAVDSQDQ